MTVTKHLATITIFLLLLASVYAADPQDAQSTTGASANAGSTAANAVSAQGGNVTEVNVSSTQSTSIWQGFWGNVSASLVLGDGANTFYDWSGVSASAVYASPDNNVDWASVAGISSTAAKEGKDIDYGLSSAAVDSINKTMTGAACTAGTQISAAAGVTPLDNVGSPSSWTTCLAEDGGGAVTDTVLGTDVVSTGAQAFNGLTVQFQLMVPVQAASTQYYFYLEI